MLWEIRFTRDQFSIQAAVEKGRELPQWYIDEPDIEVSDHFYLQAFRDLHTCRQNGMGMGPIPWKDIILYADRYGLDEDLVEPFIHIIRCMDCAYIEWADKEMESKKNG